MLGSNIYIKLGVAAVILAVILFAGHKVYNSGYARGFAVCESHYLAELKKIEEAQKKEQEKVSQLEQQLFDASKKYEKLNVTLSGVRKENEKWKAKNQDSTKEALGAATVRRINEVLGSSSLQ